MKRTLIGLILIAVFSVSALPSVRAEEAEGQEEKKVRKEKVEKKAKKAAPELEEISLTGKLLKKGKAEKPRYVLETTDGKKIALPTPKAKKGAEVAEVIKLADYVDKTVTVTAKGYVKGEGVKARTIIKTVTAIKEAEEQDEA